MRIGLVAYAATLLLSGSELAYGQTAPAPPANDQNGAVLETVVVTATRRAENVQNVPVAVTARPGAFKRCGSGSVRAPSCSSAICAGVCGVGLPYCTAYIMYGAAASANASAIGSKRLQRNRCRHSK